MSATERLYYQDSRLLEFDARVVGVNEGDDGAIAITLDRTAFYPTGGGQPHDTGTIGQARVVDCIDAGEEGVLHVIQGPTPEPGEVVHGKIDWLRRLDHLQQHTGQHLLSAAFVKLFDAPTHSFRVLEHECEIDIALSDPNDQRIQHAVDLANQIIWECRPIQIRQVNSAAAANLPLRKEPARGGELRLIEVDGFDLTPCGGTHARSTGEVGSIVVRNWERAKGLTRIQFMAGLRVLADYRKTNSTAREVAELFSAGREDSPDLVARLIDENKKLRRRIVELEEIACRVEAEDLLRANVSTSNDGQSPPILISRVFADRSADSLKNLARALVGHSRVVALLGSTESDAARLVFARSADAEGNMNILMNKACEVIDGRGGGKPDMAQGGGTNVQQLNKAIKLARSLLLKP